jgi:hypothetical protein
VHLAEIAPSIFAGLGLSDAQDLLGLGQSPHGRECLFLIDGLGEQALADYATYAPTISGLISRGPVTTSFPSTTVTSLTTLMTGELPGAHGMLGYTIRVPRSGGRILNSLKWDERVDPYTWQPVPTFFERAKIQGIQVSHVAAKRYEGTGFTAAAFRGAQYRGANVLEEMAEQACASLKDSPSFTYVYVNGVDVAGHSDGVGSDKWLGALSYVDRVTATLVERLPRGTRIWITADHGMVNVEEKIVLGRENSLLEGIALVAGEPRARHLYLDDDHLTGEGPNEAASRFREFLPGRVDVYTRKEAIAVGLFGNYVSEASQDRMGDLIVVPHESIVLIDPLRVALESAMVGHHGAMSDSERLVPLRVAEVN